MNDLAVVNTSPLVFLSRGQHLAILQHFAKRVLVPIPVIQEIELRGPKDITVITLQREGWLEPASNVTVPQEVLEWGLGPGESAVLALARENPGVEAIIDDLAARRCAASLDVPVRGTLGLVLAAKQKGIIPSAREVIQDLIEGGMYLSSTVLDEALRRVNE